MDALKLPDSPAVHHYPEGWESNTWEGRVTVAFSHPRYGWIDMVILCDAGTNLCRVRLSDVFDPFPDMLDWLCNIARGNLPALLTIDEEGQLKHLLARALPEFKETGHDVELRIIGDGYDELKQCPTLESFFLTRINRRQFLREYHRCLKSWLENVYDDSQWHIRASEEDCDGPPHPLENLRNLDLERLASLLPD